MGETNRASGVSRRKFIKDTALAGAGAAMLGGLAPARALGANDRIRIGVLGTGERARYLMSIFRREPSVELAAICDVYVPHLKRAAELAAPKARATNDYRLVLEDKDIDAVIIGAPDHWHKTMLVESVRAGKDVYCEKPIIHDIGEGQPILDAVAETRRVVQTGTQQRSWPHYILASEIVSSGLLGKITFIHAYWYQNYYNSNGWEAMMTINPAELDWGRFLGDAMKQDFTAEKYIWWRFYWSFGGGILTDLFTHWADVIQWYMKQTSPETATTTGELYLMNWECPDTIAAVYEFPGDFNVTFTGALNDSIGDGGIEFRGTKATLKIDRAHFAVYPEGQTWVSGRMEPKPEIFARSERDGTIDHVKNFLDCMKTRKTPNAPVSAGFQAARTSWIGNIALQRGLKTVWDAEKHRVVS